MNSRCQDIYQEQLSEVTGRLGVYIIDNQPLYRLAIGQVLSGSLDILGEDALNNVSLEKIEEANPDIALVDVGLPMQSGFGIARQLSNRCPKTAVVIISPNPNDEQLFQAIKSGAVAFLNKDTSPEHLIGTLKRVGRGEYPINYALIQSPSAVKRVMRLFHELNSVENCYTPLSSRETQILKYIAEGNPNKSIADALEISEQTIKNHVTSIMRKLNANDRTHAVVLAMQQGLLNINEIELLSEDRDAALPVKFCEN
jgi:two-component system, NarL family, response regulator DegU